MTSRWSLSVVLLAVFGVAASHGQTVDRDNERQGLLAPTGMQSEDECTGPPDGSEPIAYAIVYTQAQPLPLAATTTIGAVSDTGLPVQDRQQIRSEAEYVSVFGEPSAGIDWKASRIVVVELTTTYKLGDLESGEELSGVYLDANGIYVGTDYTHYGPVQGIAQLSEWFTYAHTDLFILLPTMPDHVDFFYCIIGGSGPTDIP